MQERLPASERHEQQPTAGEGSCALALNPSIDLRSSSALGQRRDQSAPWPAPPRCKCSASSWLPCSWPLLLLQVARQPDSLSPPSSSHLPPITTALQIAPRSEPRVALASPPPSLALGARSLLEIPQACVEIGGSLQGDCSSDLDRAVKFFGGSTSPDDAKVKEYMSDPANKVSEA